MRVIDEELKETETDSVSVCRCVLDAPLLIPGDVVVARSLGLSSLAI